MLYGNDHEKRRARAREGGPHAPPLGGRPPLHRVAGAAQACNLRPRGTPGRPHTAPISTLSARTVVRRGGALARPGARARCGIAAARWEAEARRRQVWQSCACAAAAPPLREDVCASVDLPCAATAAQWRPGPSLRRIGYKNIPVSIDDAPKAVQGERNVVTTISARSAQRI